MEQKNLLIGGAVVLIAVAVVLFAMSSKPAVEIEAPTTLPSNVSSVPTPLEQLAQCLKDEGAIFYGAFWCPHCRSQKELFGDAAKHLPYVECSTPDGNDQVEICTTMRIESYPTWEFKDGTRATGNQTLAELAAKTGCSIEGLATGDKG